MQKALQHVLGGLVDGGNGMSGMDAKGTHFTCFTSTKVQILTQPMLGATCHASDSTKSAQQFEDFMQAMLVLYGKVLTLTVSSVLSLLSVLILLHAGDARALWQGIQSTCFTSSKVQILTQPGDSLKWGRIRQRKMRQ
jgi:hypothetical protein